MSLSAEYPEVLAHLRTLGPELATGRSGLPARKFDLMHMRVLLGALSHPETSFRSVLIAGTNGKGSTAATLASILNAAGVRTGLYTSPHLIRVNERMQVSVAVEPTEYSAAEIPASMGPTQLQTIGDAEFARLYARVDAAGEQLVSQKLLPHTPSFFERLTAVAFLWFAERRVALAVLEVGLGGRLDATNVVTPLVSVLTDVALDHQEFLGETLAEITREKAGILRRDGTLVTLPQHPEVNQALGEIAAEMPQLRAVSAAEFIPSRAVPPEHVGMGKAGLLPAVTIDVQLGGRVLRLAPRLAGHHQQRNLALALATAQELRERHRIAIPDEAIEAGVANTRWPGRLEVRTVGGRAVLLDVAHNPAGAWTLRSALAQVEEGRPRTLLFSCLGDKDVREMAQILFPLFDGSSTDPARQRDHLVLVAIDSPRAAPVDDLLAQARRLQIPAHAAPHVEAGLQQALAITPEGGYVVATGSVYLVGEVQQAIDGERG